jgi:hypothetical protein
MRNCAVVAIGLLAACGGEKDHSVGPDASLTAGRDGSGTSDGDVSPTQKTGAPCQQGVPAATLACTGLYADILTKTLAPGVRSYVPAVPLWSDGADKKRWIWLPPGGQIDASDPNEWSFPVGTKVWKEFSRDGKRIETRLFQKVDNGQPPIWAPATYAWNADESAAVPSGGGDIVLDSDGGVYHIPTLAECVKCHNGRKDHILGFEQVSLGLPDAQGLTLTELAKEALIAPVPAQLQLTIGDDGTGAAALALSWLHINCGVTCHNANSSATAYGVGMLLRLDPTLLDGRSVTGFDPLTTTIGVPAHSPQWVEPMQWTRIVPGDPSLSLLVQLISHRGTDNSAEGQMPPIDSLIVDTDDVAHVVDWVSKMPPLQTLDAGLDAGTDATLDAGLDAGSDATLDAGTDASVGPSGDAEADATTYEASGGAAVDGDTPAE